MSQQYPQHQHLSNQYAPQYQQPQQYQLAQQHYPPQHLRQPAGQPKSVAIAMVLSFFFPGAGSMYSRNVGTGVVILVLWIIALALSLLAIGIFGVLIAWIWGLMAAYADTNRWNAASGF